MIDGIQNVAHTKEFKVKQRETRRYNSKVVPREIPKGDPMLRQVVVPTQLGKLRPKWDDPYSICHKLPHEAYKLEELNERLILRTCNPVNMRYH